MLFSLDPANSTSPSTGRSQWMPSSEVARHVTGGASSPPITIPEAPPGRIWGSAFRLRAVYHILKVWSSSSNTTEDSMTWLPSHGRSDRMMGLWATLKAGLTPCLAWVMLSIR